MTDGCYGTFRGGIDLGGLCADIMDANSKPGGTFGTSFGDHFHDRLDQRARAVVWSGNKLSYKGDDHHLRGTRPEDNGEDYVRLKKAFRKRVVELVDLQVTLAAQEGTCMVVLGLGDAASWGLGETEGAHGALNALVSRAAATTNERNTCASMPLHQRRKHAEVGTEQKWQRVGRMPQRRKHA